MLPISAKESSLSFDGVGRVFKEAGGAIGLPLGAGGPILPDAEE